MFIYLVLVAKVVAFPVAIPFEPPKPEGRAENPVELLSFRVFPTAQTLLLTSHLIVSDNDLAM